MQFSYLLALLNLVSCEAVLRIIGGRDALRDEFPFAILLEKEKRMKNSDGSINITYGPVCSASALTSDWILSSAHCYIKKNRMVARYNSHFPDDMGQISPIIKVYLHPQYTKRTILIRQNDIGLFRSQNIIVSKYAKISAVDYTTLVGHEVNVLGFGKTNATMYKKPLQVLSGMIHNCLKKEKGAAGFASSMICVVPLCGVKATICRGDSGGSLIHSSGIIGVNTIAKNDCNEFTTNLYITPGTSASIASTVSHALDWISIVILNKTVN